MRPNGDQNRAPAQKPLRDWTGWLLVALIAAALCGFIALIFYLFF